MAVFGQLWMNKNVGEEPTFDTRDVLLEVLSEGLYMLAANKGGDAKMMQQIEAFKHELADHIIYMRDEGYDFMEWLQNEFTPYVQDRFGLTEDDLSMMSQLWAEKMGEETIPSYETMDSFVSIVVQGLRQIASQREPAGKITQEVIDYIESYVVSVEDRLRDMQDEEVFATFFTETLTNELYSFGIDDEGLQVFAQLWETRYPGQTPSLVMKDQFVGVLRDGLIKLVAEAMNDPMTVF